MPSVERPLSLSTGEQEPISSYRAAQFQDEVACDQAYFQIRDTGTSVGHAISVFDFRLEDQWCVAVINRELSPDLDADLEPLLAAGQRITLSSGLLAYLQERSPCLVLEGQVKGPPWIERDRRPVQPSSSTHTGRGGR